MDLENTQNNSLAKLPLLKQGEYDTWRLRIESYIQLQDYTLWEIIEEGNSFKPVARTTTNEDGTSTTTIPGAVTAEQKILKKNDLKARSILMMTLPSEHLLTFNKHKDAKSLFEAIEARFGGNEATKKTQKTLLKQMYETFNASSSESLDSIFNRLQKIVSQLTILGEIITPEELNLKFLRSLPTEWGHSSTNDVNTANVHVSTGSTPISTASINKGNACLSDATVYAYLATQPNGSQVVHEDLEQIHEDDLDEMNLKWQLALLSMKARKFYQRTGKKIIINRSDTAGYDKKKRHPDRACGLRGLEIWGRGKFRSIECTYHGFIDPTFLKLLIFCCGSMRLYRHLRFKRKLVFLVGFSSNLGCYFSQFRLLIRSLLALKLTIVGVPVHRVLLLLGPYNLNKLSYIIMSHTFFHLKLWDWSPEPVAQLPPMSYVLKPNNSGCWVCFAFVEFEDLEGVQKAIKASLIQLAGSQVYIEERRENSSGASRGGCMKTIQRNNARGNVVAGNVGGQNRGGIINPDQAKPIKCYNCNGLGNIARECPRPKRLQDSDYFKEKMLLGKTIKDRSTAVDKGILKDYHLNGYVSNYLVTVSLMISID
ncbi:ribonuclease H-like domain-containing protein [Tanacetum coccineum]